MPSFQHTNTLSRRQALQALALLASATPLMGQAAPSPQSAAPDFTLKGLDGRNLRLAERHREHVHVVREGARGATGVQGGGCGCN